MLGNRVSNCFRPTNQWRQRRAQTVRAEKQSVLESCRQSSRASLLWSGESVTLLDRELASAGAAPHRKSIISQRLRKCSWLSRCLTRSPGLAACARTMLIECISLDNSINRFMFNRTCRTWGCPAHYRTLARSAGSWLKDANLGRGYAFGPVRLELALALGASRGQLRGKLECFPAQPQGLRGLRQHCIIGRNTNQMLLSLFLGISDVTGAALADTGAGEEYDTDFGPNQTINGIYTLQFSLVGQLLRVRLYSQELHWVGLDIGTNMHNHEAAVLELQGPSLALNTFHLKEFFPQPVAQGKYKLQSFRVDKKSFVAEISRNVSELMVNGKTFVVADSRWTLAWSDSPVLEEHDHLLAFYVNPSKGTATVFSLFKLLHGGTMTALWGVCALFAVLQLTMRKLSAWAYLLHRGVMVAVAIATIAFLIVSINVGVQSGNDSQFWDYHRLIGQILLYGVGVVLIGGSLVMSFFTGSMNLPGRLVPVISVVHRLAGGVLLTLAFVNIFSGWIIEQIWLGLGLALFAILTLICSQLVHLLRPKTETREEQPLLVSSDKFIFEDRVYPFHEVMSVHPGGQAIIRAVAGREVDRFIYGNYSLEQVGSVPPHIHSGRFLELNKAEEESVIAQVEPISQNSFRLSGKVQISKDAYVFMFRSKEKRTNQLTLDCLGKYFCVELQGVRRLYSQIYALSKANLAKLQQAKERRAVEQQDEYELAFVIKVYEQGKMTPLLLAMNKGDEINIWGPRGKGLGLRQTGPGQYAVIAAGTGLFPFVDLLCLRLNDPSQLKGYSFQFFIIFAQGNEYFQGLVKAAQQKCQNWHFTVLQERNEPALADFIQRVVGRQLKRAFVCGPPALNTQLASQPALRDRLHIL